jgi:hypothetical protein
LGLFIALLLNDNGIVGGALIPTKINQEPVQVGERRQIHTRSAHSHVGAGHWVEHPCSHRNNHTGRALNLHKPASRPFLNAANADFAAKIRMPPVVDFHILPDMGRMNG